MSTTILSPQNSPSQQLCFAWAQPEECSSADSRNASQRTRRPVERIHRPTRTAQHTQTTSVRLSPTAVPSLSVQSVTQSQPLNKNTRVGEVRLGTVMLALLKQYGITDEEIEAELTAIANG